MNILFVVPYTPNPIRVRPYQFLRSLVGRGHAVTLLTLVSNDLERESAAALDRAGIRVIDFPLSQARSLINCAFGLLTPDPLQSFYCWHPALAKKLSGMAAGLGQTKPFDIVHVEHMRGARFGDALRKQQARGGGTKANPPVIWDSVDCISHLFAQSARQNRKRLSRWINRFELGRSRAYEAKMVQRFDRTLVTSQVDRQAFQALLPAGASQPCIDVVPNGVDLQRFTPGPFEDRAAQTLVVSGKMSYHANVAMVLYLVDEVMPRVWAHMPEARLDLIGKDPPQEIQALGADPRIRVTGYVADMRPYLAGAAAAAAPLTYGAGIQNKVLEAMACGTPVVTTPLAVTALAAVPGKEILVGANAELFAQEVLHLLQDRSFRRQVGEAGRAYVETHHDWQRVATLLEHIYSEAIAQKRG